MASDGGEAAAEAKLNRSLLDLPIETQRLIFTHCDQAELICLALVSKHFHSLASMVLYRSFHIIFPDDDDLNFDSPIDGLAGGLDTFATSDYNYARHLREISMDTLSAGDRGELSYQQYLYSTSCGKFLNTLLSQTLKRTEILESFKWNIRVELSRPVYRELHKIKTLKRLQIRMQAGDSYYNPPPPLPITIDSHHAHAAPPYHQQWVPPAPTPAYLPLATPLSLEPLPALNGPPPLLHSSSKSSSKKSGRRVPSFAPSTVAGFKDLKTLYILDIDDLAVVPELKTCIQNSYSTLTELQLSFSDSLASLARRPQSDSDSDSELEDEFHTGHPPPFNYENTNHYKVYCAGEERKRQEDVLAKVFDVEPNLLKRPQLQLHANEAEKTAEAPTKDCPREEFVSTLKNVTSKLMTVVNGSRDFSNTQQDVLDIIEKAARKYVDSEESVGESAQLSDSATTTAYSEIEGTQQDHIIPLMSTAIPTLSEKDKHNSDDEGGAEHVEVAGSSPDGITGILDARPVETPSPVVSREAVSLSTSEPLAERLSDPALTQSWISGREPPKVYKTARSPVVSSRPPGPSPPGRGKKSIDDSATEYIKETRGLALEAFSVYLVPVKASVLSRALDFSALCELTLLNVGNQAPIWALLARENQIQPLPLHSIFTDNASITFLNCVAQLPQLHNLFMLERSVDQRPESFAPRASVTIDQIRRLVLKKHISGLKRLMIKDESKEANWDANEKTMILLCTNGTKLEELAVSMNIHAVHAFMQYFQGLVSLRAINILHFKNNDTCLWVMREILRFIVDNLSHHPNMQLEWIAMEDERVDRVVRPSDFVDKFLKDERKRDRQGKGKDRASNKTTTSPQYAASNPNYPVFPSVEDLVSESESDDDGFDSGNRLKFKTVGPLQFYDVWGVKIFEKEIRSGRL